MSLYKQLLLKNLAIDEFRYKHKPLSTEFIFFYWKPLWWNCCLHKQNWIDQYWKSSNKLKPYLVQKFHRMNKISINCLRDGTIFFSHSSSEQSSKKNTNCFKWNNLPIGKRCPHDTVVYIFLSKYNSYKESRETPFTMITKITKTASPKHKRFWPSTKHKRFWPKNFQQI